MSNKETARKYLEHGLNVVPTDNGSKVPLRPKHQTPITFEELDNYNWGGIGISTGTSSGNLQCIDLDLYNIEDREEVLEEYKNLVGEDLLTQLVIQKTVKGGYHLIFRCPVIQSSQKLANSEEGSAFIETRELGGYFKCYPSEGYEILQGDLLKVPDISPEDRMRLIISARQMNRTIKQDSKLRVPEEQRDYESKFPEYDSEPQIGIDLLEEHGWQFHSEVGNWYNMTRPDKDVRDGMSGGYNKEGLFYYNFSVNDPSFDTLRPYSNSQIFCELECGGNYKKGYAKLFEQGHGVEEEEEEDMEIDFLSSTVSENSYLSQVIEDNIPLGLTLGFPSLDPYYKLKKNSLDYIQGYENVGKSFFISTYMAITSVLHDYTTAILSPENSNALNRRNFIEALSGKDLSYFDNRRKEYQRYLDYSRDKLKIISNDKHYSLKDGIEMGKRLYEIYGIDNLVLDPLSAFKMGGNNDYSYLNEMLSEIRIFTENYCSVTLVGHVFTGAARNNKSSDGFQEAPTKYDAAFGNTVTNRVSNFITVHRITNHPSSEMRRTMQVIVEKVKNTESGGKNHDKGDYSELVYDIRDGFKGYFCGETGENPIYKAMLSKLGKDSLSQKGLGDRIKY